MVSGSSDVDLVPITSNLDVFISLHLHAWPALTHAISNAWGGSPQLSNDKRDWFAGAISELITPDLKTGESEIDDVEDLEEVLMQVMLDEFEVVVDDGSCAEVAQKIMRGRAKVLGGDFAEVQEMQRQWGERRGAKQQVIFKKVEENEDGQDTDWDDDDDEEEEEWNGFPDGDAEMNEAPPLVEAKKEKAPPEIDEDGFTKVFSKRKR